MVAAILVAMLVLAALLVAVDLGALRREPDLTINEAFAWTAVWTALAPAAAVVVYYVYENDVLALAAGTDGAPAARRFLTIYLAERAVSAGNVFVIAMIFAALGVPLRGQRRALRWGIVFAVVLRAAAVALGALLLRFAWAPWAWAALLAAAGIRLLVARQDTIHPRHSPAVRLLELFAPVREDPGGSRFFAAGAPRRAATPLLVALVLIAGADVLFAAGSLGAGFAFSGDVVLVAAGNAFAILGLRALYFALAGLMVRRRFPKLTLVLVLLYAAVVSAPAARHDVSDALSLAVVGVLAAAGVAVSLLMPAAAAAVSPLAGEVEDLAVLTYRQARRVVILLLGCSVVLAGLAMVVLPGPAVVIIPLGLAILAAEFTWARRWLQQIRAAGGSLGRRLRGRE